MFFYNYHWNVCTFSSCSLNFVKLKRTVCRYSAQSIETIGIFCGLPININDTYGCWQNIKANIKLIKLPSVILAMYMYYTTEVLFVFSKYCTDLVQNEQVICEQIFIKYNCSSSQTINQNNWWACIILHIFGRTLGIQYSVIQASPVCRNKIQLGAAFFEHWFSVLMYLYNFSFCFT